jgi:hypothetical protein
LNYYTEYGSSATEEKLKLFLKTCLMRIGDRESVYRLTKLYTFNKTFQSYYVGNNSEIPKNVIRAIITDPKLITNRGLISILFAQLLEEYCQHNEIINQR